MENLTKLEKLLNKMDDMLSAHHKTLVTHELVIKILTDLLVESKIATLKEIEGTYTLRMGEFIETLKKTAEEEQQKEKAYKESVHELLASMRPEGHA